jgi:hypothetical protein
VPPATYPSLTADTHAWIESIEPRHVTGPGVVGLGAYRSAVAIDPGILRRALNELAERHEILRTVLVPAPGGGLRHRPGPPGEVPLRVVDVPEPTGRDLSPELVAAVEQPLGVPLRAVLGRHPGPGCTLVLVASHSSADHWSMELMARDLAALVDGLTHGRPAEVEVHPFAIRAREAYERRDEARVDAAAGHWRGLLHDLPPLVPPVADPGAFSAEHRFELRADRAALTAVARAARTTPFVGLLAAYARGLAEWAGVDEVLIPLFTSGRERLDWQSVGPFMNVGAVRVRPGGLPVPELLPAVHAAFVRAYAHEQPLVHLLPRVPEIAALYRADGVPVAGFELVQFPAPGREPAPLPLDRLPIGPRHGATVLPLSGLLCWLEADGPDRFAGTIRYRPGLFGADRIAGLVRAFARSAEVFARSGSHHASTV